jgi:hypothetical protein
MSRRLLLKAMVLSVVIQLAPFAEICTSSAQDPLGMPPPPIPVEMLDRHTFRVSPPEMVSPGVYRIGEITVNKTEKSISFPAEINMDKGLLEYLLVRNAGKTHESLFRTKIEPYNLQIASLLVDLAGTDNPLAFQGAPEAPKGDAVSITVSMTDKDGKISELKPEKWITKVVDGKHSDIEPLRWIFTGSIVRGGRFGAQVSGSIIALYHDPVAMVDNASAGGESDKIWFVNEKTVPVVGTPVTITIKAVK